MLDECHLEAIRKACAEPGYELRSQAAETFIASGNKPFDVPYALLHKDDENPSGKLAWTRCWSELSYIEQVYARELGWIDESDWDPSTFSPTLTWCA